MNELEHAHNDLVIKVKRLQGKLQTGSDDDLFIALGKLAKLPMSVEVLQETGVGISLNALRKHSVLGKKAKELVGKWKGIAKALSPERKSTSISKRSLSPQPENGGSFNDILGIRDVQPLKNGSKRKSADLNGSRSKVEEPTSSQHQSRSHKKTPVVPSHETFENGNGFSFEQVLGLNDPSRGSSSGGGSKAPRKQQQSLPIAVPKAVRVQPSYKLYAGTESVSSKLDDVVLDYKPGPNLEKVDEKLAGRKRDVASSSAKDVRQDSLDIAFQSKHSRTSVFAGRRTKTIDPDKGIPSLYELAQQCAVENMHRIATFPCWEDSFVSYDLIAPVLLRANIDALIRMEENNPYIIKETDDLWKRHCLKRFRTAQPDIESAETWREAYFRLVEEEEHLLRNLSRNISKDQQTNVSVRKTMLAMPEAPRHMRRKQEKFGTSHVKPSGASQVAEKRRQLDERPSSSLSLQSVSRAPRSHHLEAEIVDSPKHKQRKAPMMAKTLKMMKSSR